MVKKIFFLFFLAFQPSILSIEIDQTFIDTQLPAFTLFVYKIENYCNAQKWVPSFLQKSLNTLATGIQGYTVDSSELKKLDRFFKNQTQSKEGIKNLKEENNIQYIQSIIDDETAKNLSHKLLIQKIDTMTLKRLGDDMAKHIEYFECMAANLFCVYIFEHKLLGN